MNNRIRIINYALVIVLVIMISLGLGLWYHMKFYLPDTQQLNHVQLQVPLQIYTSDGKLIAIFGEQRRIPIAYEHIPKALIAAIIATEDQRYFQHQGVDIPGLLRAMIQLLITGQKEQGGSTITMQLARSFYLSPNKTFVRKLREILLAIKIEHTLSKQKILELYLNKIFFGNRAYGVAAAAQLYYGKPLQQLSLAQYAMLAGIPKAPSVLNPLANKLAALARRNHVLTRMFELHYISQKTYYATLQQPLTARYHVPQIAVYTPHVAEIVRQQAEAIYGPHVYSSGIKVYTTIQSKLQNFAHQAVLTGLINYDQRHGYRGSTQNLGQPSDQSFSSWIQVLKRIPLINQLEPAVVISKDDFSINVLRSDGTKVNIAWDKLQWAKKRTLTGDKQEIFSPGPTTTNDIVAIGDIVRIIWLNGWSLVQIPQAEASLIALEPNTGAIMSLVGGFDYQQSNFDRVTKALRQPGSLFKPFIYSAALNKGFTLASIINDSPVVVKNQRTIWRPQNSNHQFLGPTSLRSAITNSRNLVAIRVLEQIGINYAIDYIAKFGFERKQLPASLSLALGTAELTALQLAGAYAIFANGGYKINPYLITKMVNSTGKILFQANPVHVCKTYQPHNHCAPPVISKQNAFLITNALHDVIETGTAQHAKILHRHDLAGKTGTTQKQHDAWFAGYNSHLVSITWLGFDQPQAIYEYGNQAALPIWIAFMANALATTPDLPSNLPNKLVSVLIDPQTGNRSSTTNPAARFEYFTTATLPVLHMKQDHFTDNAAQLY